MQLATRFARSPAARISVLFLLLNAPITWATLDWGLSRPLLNLDYLLPIFLAIFSAVGALLLFLGLYLIDVVSSLSIAYHFDSPSNFIRSANATPAIVKTLTTEPRLLFLTVPPVFWLLILKWQPSIKASLRNALREIVPMAAIVVLLVIADVNVGASMLDTNDQTKTGPNIAGSPLASQSKRALTYGSSPAPTPTHATIFDADRAALFARDGAVMLVAVESMGLPLSPQARQWLDAMARSAPPNQVTQRQVDFKGSTVAAELRHLCATVSSVPDDVAPDQCLPMLARAAHRRSFAVHGNSGNTFNRSQWWPRLGFDQVFFRENLIPRHAELCDFAYKAVCDRALIDFMFRELKSNDFAYGLTVSTHLPIPRLDTDATEDFCNGIRVKSTPCRIIWQHGQVLAYIAAKVRDSRAPMVAYVVGDHAPPFLSTANRAAFSAKQTIGWKIENTSGTTP
ncbi:hypothetical protein [Roseateles hydrophilus]|uniref:hypothetical protein n=1 Tax=Roseateles hydrophilus TaxID=2975054 RepID=UPI00227CCE8B|nr:hypothetical protein [Pelomonas sp. UHG3]